MSQHVTTLLRRPAAWLPLVMSGAALALVLGYAILVGAGHTQAYDEQAPARLFQAIMLAELLAMSVFAARWLPRATRPAALILSLQLVAAVIPIVTVLALESRL